MREELANLSRLLAKLEEVNSFYPATRQFLRARGLDRVSELGSDGRRELLAHLRRLYDRRVQ